MHQEARWRRGKVEGPSGVKDREAVTWNARWRDPAGRRGIGEDARLLCAGDRRDPKQCADVRLHRDSTALARAHRAPMITSIQMPTIARPYISRASSTRMFRISHSANSALMGTSRARVAM